MKNLKTIAAVVILAGALILAGVAYAVLKTPAAASSPIEAIPLVSTTPGASGAGALAQATPTAAPAAATTEATTPAEPAPAAAATTDAAAAGSGSAIPAGLIHGEVVQEETEVRFLIDEVLNGEPKTVVGTTNQIAAEVAVDPTDLAKSRLGVVRINARTLTTDNEFRNRAIKNRILHTDQYEFITFTPIRIEGVPQQAGMGQDYTFQVVGNLTIRDVTREVTFDVTARAVSPTRLEGTARATIRYADFGITIPQVPQVASVADEVRLEIEGVIEAKN